jgi:hypothetical protein
MQHRKTDSRADHQNTGICRLGQCRNDVMQAGLSNASGQAPELPDSDRRRGSTPAGVHDDRHLWNGIQHDMKIHFMQRPSRCGNGRMHKLLRLALRLNRRFTFFQRELSKTLLLMPAVRNRRFLSVTGGQPRRHNQDAEEKSHVKKLSQPWREVNAIHAVLLTIHGQNSITPGLSGKNTTKTNDITLITPEDVITATGRLNRKHLPLLESIRG